MANSETNSKERRVIDNVLQRDEVFRNQLLGRLQADCEYFLNFGNRDIERLWAGSVNLQIKLMVELYNSFDEKPEWLTMDEIIAYGKKMAECDEENDQLSNDLKNQGLWTIRNF